MRSTLSKRSRIDRFIRSSDAQSSRSLGRGTRRSAAYPSARSTSATPWASQPWRSPGRSPHDSFWRSTPKNDVRRPEQCAAGARPCGPRSTRRSPARAPTGRRWSASPAPPETLVTDSRESARTTSGRLVSVCGQIGVSTIASQVRRQDRPAGRQRVGGRAGRRRDDHAVGLVGRDRPRRRAAPRDPAGARSTAGRCTASLTALRVSPTAPSGRADGHRQPHPLLDRQPALGRRPRAPRAPRPRAKWVMKPRLPRFTPNSGTPWSATSLAP